MASYTANFYHSVTRTLLIHLSIHSLILRASYESGTRLDTKITEMSNLQPHPWKKSKCNKGNRPVKIKVHHEKGFAQGFSSRTHTSLSWEIPEGFKEEGVGTAFREEAEKGSSGEHNV